MCKRLYSKSSWANRKHMRYSKNGTCHKTYLVSCSNGTRPALEITASLLNQGLGTITIKGRKISNEVTSYYLDDSSNPTVDSLWKDFADSNKVAYEQKRLVYTMHG